MTVPKKQIEIFNIFECEKEQENECDFCSNTQGLIEIESALIVCPNCLPVLAETLEHIKDYRKPCFGVGNDNQEECKKCKSSLDCDEEAEYRAERATP